MTGVDGVPVGDTSDEEAALRIDVLRGNPTSEELAAAVAVVSESYRSEAAAAVAEEGRRRSAWEISARSLRQPLRREVGWGRFSG